MIGPTRRETPGAKPRMHITFLQTADTTVYRAMLETTSRSFLAYCGLHDLEYSMFLGTVRGAKPWHAALNRVPLLRKLMDSGHGGWVVYADADAYVSDLHFDLKSYLADKGEHFMIASSSGVNPSIWWDINNGVFALNLAHPLSDKLIAKWQAKFDEVSDERLFAETAWGEALDDQHALHLALQEVPGAQAGLLRDEQGVFNWEGRFIAQLVRDPTRYTRASRLSSLKTRVGSVLDEAVMPADVSAEQQARAALYEEFVGSLYRVFFGRPADMGGRAYASGRLLSGERTMEGEIRACIASPEGRAHLPVLLQELFGPGGLEQPG